MKKDEKNTCYVCVKFKLLARFLQSNGGKLEEAEGFICVRIEIGHL